ncbi:hypothetical protein BDV30DRAFT_210697 [Aspergillus minisclerotigenes]|uniref:Uncharacterized protein n=1 Tax=Aspergillus minisclerotigenes TaxID=656917 RepID=A0A5N6J5F8_9EURO|nr:hypothetical protein BDV30DRAFT_210697 [Aspergillus minisclerotigenes]
MSWGGMARHMQVLLRVVKICCRFLYLSCFLASYLSVEGYTSLCQEDYACLDEMGRCFVAGIWG